MYIRIKEGLGGLGAGGLGDAATYTPWRERLGLRSKPQYLRFLNLDNFGHNKLSLTDVHRNMLDDLVKHVEASWKTTRPIVTIHLIGHTDNTGNEKYNVRLGDERAKVVEAELLGKLRRQGLLNKVAIVVEPSVGESKPTADNRTEAGRAANRRVEIFIRTGILPSVPRSTSPKDLWEQAREAARRVEEEAERRRQQQIYNPPIPTPPRGKSISDRLDERLPRLPKKWRKRVRNAILSGACALLETLLGQVVGQLSDKEKDDLRKICLERAKKPG